MFVFTLGSIVGFFAAMIAVSTSLIITKDAVFDITVWTNISIALGTAVAVLIHYDSAKKQRKDRIWEINKDVLIELLNLNSQLIDETELFIEDRSQRDDFEWKKEIQKKFNYQTNLAINVYGVLMEDSLIKSIEKSIEEEDSISESVIFFGLDNEEAYELSLENRRILQKDLKEFVSKMSGVND